MRRIIADWVAWCLSVCRNREPCKKSSWIHPDAVWDVDSGGPKELCIRWRSRSPHAKGHFWRVKSYLHGKWLAERARSKILQQEHPSSGETPDEVHFSCRRLCWKVIKYDVHILWLAISGYELFERPSYVRWWCELLWNYFDHLLLTATNNFICASDTSAWLGHDHCAEEL